MFNQSTQQNIQQWLTSSIHKVFLDQPELWNWKLGERARVVEICFDLRGRVPEPWNVDAEWNREGQEGSPKKLPNVPGQDFGTPDLIIHRRGELGPQNNLLVAEFKNEYNARDEEKDLAKIVDWMDRYDYRFGAVVALTRSPDGLLAPQALWVNGDGISAKTSRWRIEPTTSA